MPNNLEIKLIGGICNCCGTQTTITENTEECFVCAIKFVEYKEPCKKCTNYWKRLNKKFRPYH